MNSKIVIIITLFICFVLIDTNAQADINKTKAVYIYNFLNNVVWPDSKQSDEIVIGVLGKSQTYDELVLFTRNRTVGNKRLKIIKLFNEDQYSSCHVIFISEEKSNELKNIQKLIGYKSCLIIGEKEGLSDLGATISFALNNNRLQFKINQKDASNRKLLVSNNLINMSL